MSYTINIISLALNQTKFWLKVISNKNSDDLNYKIISFDTESSNFLYKKKLLLLMLITTLNLINLIIL